jgi:hypothetical protein
MPEDSHKAAVSHELVELRAQLHALEHNAA